MTSTSPGGTRRSSARRNASQGERSHRRVPLSAGLEQRAARLAGQAPRRSVPVLPPPRRDPQQDAADGGRAADAERGQRPLPAAGRAGASGRCCAAGTSSATSFISNCACAGVDQRMIDEWVGPPDGGDAQALPAPAALDAAAGPPLSLWGGGVAPRAGCAAARRGG